MGGASMVSGRAGVLAGIVVALCSRHARAWGDRAPPCPPDPSPEMSYLAPRDGAMDVPIDTLIWGGGSADSYVVVGEGGAEVPLLDRGELDVGGMLLRAFAPARLLDPDTFYQVWGCTPDACIGPHAEFRTGAGAAAPPTVPVMREQDPGPERHEHRVDLFVDFDGVLVVADADSTFDGVTWEGSINTVHVDPDVTVRFPAGCGHDSWPYDADSAELKFAAFNLAGRMSDWSEPELVMNVAGCNLAGSPGWAFAVVLLAVRRRRRRSGGPE